MRAALVIVGLAVLGIAAGCSSTRTVQVPLPPRVDLTSYRTIGLVQFSTNANDAELAKLGTQRFLQSLQDAQPGTRVIELPADARGLKAAERRGWNADTCRDIKQAHGVDAIVIGRFDVKESTPDVHVSTARPSFRVSADVQTTLSAKLIETDSGATLWTDSADAVTNVTHAAFGQRGGHVGVSSAEATYGAMLSDMAWQITEDFRTHYVTRRVSKDEQAVASADGASTP